MPLANRGAAAAPFSGRRCPASWQLTVWRELPCHPHSGRMPEPIATEQVYHHHTDN